MSSFWSGWIIILTSTCLLLTTWLLFANRTTTSEVGQSTGHEYDGIQEFDNPLPAWWFYLFVITLVFGVGYLAAYPGMGSYKGFLNWTAVGQLESERAAAQAIYGPIFDKFAAMELEDVARDPQALQMGQRVFANNCSVCHGSDARGGHGFPNLTDNDWLYGGAAQTIKETITNGRNGAMPAWGPVLGDEGVENVAQYVLTLSGREADATKASAGKVQFDLFCVACHMTTGEGNQLLGAPNLTDDIWLYGGSPMRIKQSISEGRFGLMPTHRELLNENKIHLLAAYIFSLSN